MTHLPEISSPILSIVIPTFNQGAYIEDCLESIRRQTFTDFEVIIQDACSEDQTGSVCRTFAGEDPRFRYYREKDSGQSDALNRGLARSRGKIWTWICSDDYYADPKALDLLVNGLLRAHEGDPSVVGIFGDAWYVKENKEVYCSYGNKTRNLSLDDFKQEWPLAQPASLLLREAVVKAGGVDVNLHLGMDLDLFVKILKGGKYLVYLPQMTAHVRMQPDSKTVRYRMETSANALMVVGRHFPDFGRLQDSVFYKQILDDYQKIVAERDWMRSSWSWRVTAPFRAVWSGLQRFLGLFRKRTKRDHLEK